MPSRYKCRRTREAHFIIISARIAFLLHIIRRNRDTSSCANGQHAKGGATSNAVHIRGIAGGAAEREAISTLDEKEKWEVF